MKAERFALPGSPRRQAHVTEPPSVSRQISAMNKGGTAEYAFVRFVLASVFDAGWALF